MGILEGSAATKVEVPAALVSVFRSMLLRMKHQMEIRLGVQTEKTDSTRLLSGVKALLRSKGKLPPPVPLNKRNKLQIDVWVPDGGSCTPLFKHLLSQVPPAGMQLRAKKDPEIEYLLKAFRTHHAAIATSEDSPNDKKELSQKMLGYIHWWAKEAEQVSALSGAGLGFMQQGSGIDVIFSSYLWANKLGCRSYTQFTELNSLLVGIAQSPQGKTKTTRMLQEMGTPTAPGILTMMSKSTEIHLPPFVLNSSRLYDLVTTFGAFPIDDVTCEGLDGFSCSPRYVLNLRRESGEGLALIGKSWEMWCASYAGEPGREDISESEQLFHQFLLHKTSIFQNTHNLSGNALNVEIVSRQTDVFTGLDAYLSKLVSGSSQGLPPGISGPVPRAGFGRTQKGV
ncbi:unnamed protein product [Ixodes persulcatus]